MKRFSVKESASGALGLRGGGFARTLRAAADAETQGRAVEACQMRLDAVTGLLEGLDDDARLDWDDAEARAAMELLYASAADHFAIGDTEMAAAMWERLTELDEEDRMEATVMLAFCYPELGESDCFDDALFDISPKSPEYHLLSLWNEYRLSGGVDRDALRMLRTRHAAWFGEFTAAEHPVSEEYLTDSRSQHPSAAAEARELWFATAPLWRRHPDFIEALRKA